MVIEDVREMLPEDSIVFDNPSFDRSIIGYSYDDCVIYSYDEMVKELMEDDKISEMDAIDFIEYNTIRSIPYIEDCAPIIMYNI